MTPNLEKCPICEGELTIKDVTKVVRGNGHTATLQLKAPVCSHCGERLYSMEQVKWFDQVRAQLKNNNTEDFQVIGTSFQVSENQ